jgi:hypothetical protein
MCRHVVASRAIGGEKSSSRYAQHHEPRRVIAMDVGRRRPDSFLIAQNVFEDICFG